MPELQETTLGKFLLEIKKYSAKEFRARYPHPFLLREVEVETQEDRKVERVSRLLRRREALLAAGDDDTPTDAPAGAVRQETRLVFLTMASGKSKPGDSVSLGTHEQRDLVIGGAVPAAGVSPRQATFVLGSTQDWYVQDDGSEWGTFVEGVRVPSKEPLRLADTDRVRLGKALEYRFFSSAGLFAYIRFNSKLHRAKAKRKREQSG